MAYDGDLSLPAKSSGHAIHHGLFGLKFKEKSDQIGHNRAYLVAGDQYKSKYFGPRDFVIKMLTTETK